MPSIKIKETESFDVGLRKFRRACERAGIVTEVRKREFFVIKGGAKGLAEYGINVNGYGPGVVRTEMWEQLDKELVAMGKFDKHGESMDSIAENMILMKRYSYPEDIVGTASFLASGESDYMTGQILMIDGGMVIQ